MRAARDAEAMPRARKRRWILGLTGAVLVLWLGTGVYLQHAATVLPYDVTRSYEATSGVSDDQLSRRFDHARFVGLTQERLTLTSNYGYSLRATLILNPRPSQDTVLLGGYALALMPLGDLFLDRGFNVLTYYPVTRTTSYGYREKHDLEQLVTLVDRRFPKGLIGVFGSSAGGAIAIQHAAMTRDNPGVGFYMVDCAFSDLADIIRFRVHRDLGAPDLLRTVTAASLVNYVRAGHSFARVSPAVDVATVRVPILFIHGKNDPEIPASMTSELYNAKPEPKLLWIHEGSGHGLAVTQENRDLVGHKIDELLRLARAK